MTKTARLLILRLLVVIVGVSMLGFSIAALFWANLGSDPTSVLVDGLHKLLGISHGNASNLVNISLLLLLVLVDRSKLGISTVLAALALGSFISLSQNFCFNLLPPTQSLPLRLLVCLLALILNGAGLGLYISADLGAMAFDGLILNISQRFKVTPKLAMYGFYLVVFVAGVASGGGFGIGTLLSLLLCGSVFEFFLDIFQRTLTPRLQPGRSLRLLAAQHNGKETH